MGNLLSSKMVYNICWKGAPNEPTVGQCVRIAGSYPSTSTAEVFISGRRLNCTLEVNGATVFINDANHQVSIKGNDLTIHARAPGVRLRLEGNNTTVTATANDVRVYTDTGTTIILGDGATSLHQFNLMDTNGNPNEGLPVLLELPERTNTEGNPEENNGIRYAYIVLPEEKDRSGDSEQSTSNAPCKRPADPDPSDESDSKKPKTD